MSRFGAWMRKELQEQRGAWIGVATAIVLITAAPYVLMPDEITPQQLDNLPGVAIALATLVLGLDLFARETRRGTHALILRTPGALRAALPAKLTVFVVGVAAALALEEAIRHGLSAATGIPYPNVTFRGTDGEPIVRPRDMRPIYALGIRSAVLAALVALAVGFWHLVGSILSPRAGVGALFGVLGLVLLGVPIGLLFASHPWWFRLSTGEAFAWIGAVAFAGLVVGAVAWYSGRRFLFPRRRAAIRAGVVGLGLCALATVATASAISRWESPDASVPELRIYAGMTVLGADGRHLYVTTSRGEMADTFRSFESGDREAAPPRASPPSAWNLDLSDGARVTDVRFAAYYSRPRGVGQIFSPSPVAVRIQATPPGRHVLDDDPWTWIDTRLDRELVTGVDRTVNERTIAATRSVMKATTPLRDSKGRRVWRLEGLVERDGDEARASVATMLPRLGDGSTAYDGTVLGVDGWIVSGSRPDSRLGPFGLWRIDVETGAIQELSTRPGITDITSIFRADAARPSVRADGDTDSSTHFVLDDGHLLVRGSSRRGDGTRWDSGWMVVDHATGASRPLGGPEIDYDIQLVDVGTLLTRESVDAGATGADRATRLTLWKPIPDERRLVTSSDPRLLSAGGVDGHTRLPDGRWLIKLFEASGFREGRVACALLDAKAAVLTPLSTWSDASLDPIAVDVDGSFLAVEGGRRIVRFADAGARRVVVWPK